MIYHSGVGDILMRATDEALIELRFLTANERAGISGRETEIHSSILGTASAQLDEYFKGDRRDLSVPLYLGSTPFMQEVWGALMNIPYGETRRYGEIAASIGRPKAARAVGMACNRNPVALFIPCHRVVGANGNLVGFRGGVDIKEKLLALERSTMYSSQVKD